MQTDILEIGELTVTFRTGREEIRAVDQVSFTLKKGCTTGIVGESGSGKSVTALSLMHLLPSPPAIIHAKKMLLFDQNDIPQDINSLDNRQMQRIRGNRISMIFQEPMTSLNPVTRCGNQVVEAIRAHQALSRPEAKKKILEIFREVLLPHPEEIFYSYPHELSGGQKQRVMIAMAVASRPDILIADEPTTALDVTVQKSILQLLKDLQLKYGMAILFITHDLGLISGIADDLLVMKNGEIVESGPVKEVFSSPKHPYTRGLLACRPPLDISLKKLPTVGDFLHPGHDENNDNLFRLLKRDENKYQEKLREIYLKKPLLETDSLITYFPLKARRGAGRSIIKAVDSVSLNVFPGEVLGLVGESGCGKTTLGRSILRLIEPTGGKIRFQGLDLMEIHGRKLKRLRKDIQIIFQDPYSSLNPKMTVGAAITEPMTVHGIGRDNRERRELTFELLEKTGLDKKFFYRYPHELSGGQRQRVCIARALSVQPKFIICDESVSALDVSVQAQVLNLLQELKEEFGFTYIFISHDLSVVKFISDRIAVMKDGKIIETGMADEVYRSPKSEYTKKLIGAIPS
ncbi:MAG: ABC transporter ATP-binding protein [Bacteroidales bacterium]|nr:ABC transporter ATP-binding protein [Bacteroidales bacterium]